MRAEMPLELAMSELLKKLGSDSVRSTRKYRVEKKFYTLNIYDRKSGTKVFSNTEENDPCYCYDRPDYGEAPHRKYFSAHAVSPDEKYLLLAYVGSIPNCDYTSTEFTYFKVFEIETGKYYQRNFESSERFSARSVINADFTSDGKYIIASFNKDVNNLIALAWDFETGKIIMKTEGPRPKTAGSEKPRSDAETEKKILKPAGEENLKKADIDALKKIAPHITEVAKKKRWKWIIGGIGLLAGGILIKWLKDETEEN